MNAILNATLFVLVSLVVWGAVICGAWNLLGVHEYAGLPTVNFFEAMGVVAIARALTGTGLAT